MQKAKQGSWFQIEVITAMFCFCLGVSGALFDQTKTQKPTRMDRVTEAPQYSGINPEAAW